MVLFQVNAIGIALRPFEGDAPWAVDVQTVAPWLSLQAMELYPGQMEVCQRARLIQGVQAPQRARLQVRTHFGARAGLKKRLESGVPETFDHRTIVKQCLTQVKAWRTDPAVQRAFIIALIGVRNFSARMNGTRPGGPRSGSRSDTHGAPGASGARGPAVDPESRTRR